MRQILRRVAEAGSGVLLAGFGASNALAVRIDTRGGNAPVDIKTPINLATGPEIIDTIYRVITTAAVVLFVVLLLVGGIQYLSSFGNEEGTTKAKKLIIDAVVGLFIVLAAAGVAGFILGQFGVIDLGSLFGRWF